MTRESTTTAPTTLREGDIYHWSWKPGSQALDRLDPYWCRARLAQVRGGRLLDLYWGRMAGADEAISPADVDLALVANMADLEQPVYRPAHEFYESADIVNLRHANGGEVWVRKGAAPSLRVQIEVCTRKRDQARADMDREQRRLDELRAALDRPTPAEACT